MAIMAMGTVPGLKLKVLGGDQEYDRAFHDESMRKMLVDQKGCSEYRAGLMLDIYEHVTQEYLSESERLEEILEAALLRESSFSKAGRQALNALVAGADLLNLGSTQESAFYSAILSLEKELEAARDAREAQDAALAARRDRLTAEEGAVAQLRQLAVEAEEDLTTLDQSADFNPITLGKETASFKKKQQKYTRTEQGYRLLLEERGLPSPEAKAARGGGAAAGGSGGGTRGVGGGCRHHELVAARQNVDTLDKKLQDLRRRLSVFNSLPPDETLARIEVEKKRKELATLEAQFLHAVENI